MALNVGWLLSKEEGFEFLCAIDENQSMELYGVKAVQMIIEVLYDTFRKQIYTNKHKVYICEMILIHLMLWMNEVIHHD